jgi:hypothetical protein
MMHQGIQPPYIAFYTESIRFNCDAAIGSIEFVASFIEMTNKANGEYEMTRELQTTLLDHLQNILVHAAALSRYFWPSKPGPNDLHEKRGRQLRELFGVPDESALKVRKLRNQLEHFDENLDHYLAAKPIVGYIMPAYVGGEPERSGVPSHMFRAFYIDTGVFEVLGVRHEIQPIVDALYELWAKMNGEERT